MDGIGTYGVQFRDVFVPDDSPAEPAGPFVKKSAPALSASGHMAMD